MSSFFGNVVSWFQHSPAVSAEKQAVIKELSDSAQQLLSKVETHAPDMVQQIQNKLTDVLTTAVAGALTRK